MQMKFCPQCNTYNSDSATTCENCGASLSSASATSQTVLTTERPMKWYKFIIYFQLFASGVLTAIQGLSLASGATYSTQGVDASTVYSYYNGLQVVDILFGLMMLVLAVLCFISRSKLAGFKADGPSFYLKVLGASVGVSLLYIVIASMVTGVNLVGIQTIVGIIANVVLIFINKQYFDKRSDLFVR